MLLCLVDYKVGNSTIAAFIKNRNTKEDIIMPKRGTIYDINGNVLANDVVSYTLIAYLSNERVDAKGNKNYVEDIDDTSTKLAGVLGVTSEEIKDVLVKGKESNKYQVEFGTIGKGLSELTKEEIETTFKVAKIINDTTAIACTACNYCKENCPMQIQIPEVFELLIMKNVLAWHLAVRKNIKI